MKALKEMNMVEKAYLLAKLFPNNLSELTFFIQLETDRFKKQEDYLRSVWVENTLITANFWFGLIDSNIEIIERYQFSLIKNPKVFSDQLFDGYNSIFSTNCLIEYTKKQECEPKIKQAIHLLFGVEQIVQIDLNPI